MNALLNHEWGRHHFADRVWTQVTGLAPERAVNRLLMALNFQAFVDNSTGPAGELVVAGHVATAEVWVQFSKEWGELLEQGFGTINRKNGRPHFKMTDMAGSPERMARVPAFNALIEKFVPLSISCHINVEEYHRALSQAKETALRVLNVSTDMSLWDNPFLFVWRGLIDSFHRLRENERYKNIIPLDEKVDFIFDNQSEKSVILRLWDNFIETRPDEYQKYFGATPRFEDDQDFLPLQAADFWAWWVRERYEEDGSDFPEKMMTFDFGAWKGKERVIMPITYREEDMVQYFVSGIMEYAAFSERPSGFP